MWPLRVKTSHLLNSSLVETSAVQKQNYETLTFCSHGMDKICLSPEWNPRAMKIFFDEGRKPLMSWLCPFRPWDLREKKVGEKREMSCLLLSAPSTLWQDNDKNEKWGKVVYFYGTTLSHFPFPSVRVCWSYTHKSHMKYTWKYTKCWELNGLWNT